MDKIKEKKGFTLVELLAVIALIAILSGLAVTNILSSINNSKKSQFLLDAKRMVSKAEYLISENRTYRTNAKSASGVTFYFSQLNAKGEFQLDADGGSFNSSTYVKVTYSSNKYNYCVYVIGSKRNIKNGSSCVSSTTLTGIDVVNDN